MCQESRFAQYFCTDLIETKLSSAHSKKGGELIFAKLVIFIPGAYSTGAISAALVLVLMFGFLTCCFAITFMTPHSESWYWQRVMFRKQFVYTKVMVNRNRTSLAIVHIPEYSEDLRNRNYAYDNIRFKRYKISQLYNINVSNNEQFKCICYVSGKIDYNYINKQDIRKIDIADYTNKSNDNNDKLQSNQKQNGFKKFMKRHINPSKSDLLYTFNIVKVDSNDKIVIGDVFIWEKFTFSRSHQIHTVQKRVRLNLDDKGRAIEIANNINDKLKYMCKRKF